MKLTVVVLSIFLIGGCQSTSEMRSSDPCVLAEQLNEEVFDTKNRIYRLQSTGGGDGGAREAELESLGRRLGRLVDDRNEAMKKCNDL
jgi:hypothetical protein